MTPSETPVFSAVVPVYNSIEHLTASLDSICRAAARHGRSELIVVDHGSTDGSWELLQERYVDRAVLLRSGQGSIGAVRNQGAARARGHYLAFLDSDCVVPEDYFVAAEDVLGRVPVAATGCEVDIPPDPHWTERAWHELHAVRRDRFVSFLNSANFVIRADVFHDIGGFDERLATGEDAEICQRLEDAGHRIWECQAIQAIHLRNPKTVRGFYRRQVWHGAGMFDSNRKKGLDKPTAMMFLHLALTGVGGVGLLLPGLSTSRRALILFLSQVTVPVMSVSYRYIRARRFRDPGASLFLYWLYYWARAKALYGIFRRGRAVYWRSS